MGKPNDLVQGTLDFLILHTLERGPMHGWAIAKRIQQISDDVLQVPQGSPPGIACLQPSTSSSAPPDRQGGSHALICGAAAVAPIKRAMRVDPIRVLKAP